MAARSFMGPDLDLSPLGQPTAPKASGTFKPSGAPATGKKIGKATPKSGTAKTKSITRDRRRILMEELAEFDVRQLSVAISNAAKVSELNSNVKGALDLVFRNRLVLLTKIIAEERRLGTLKAQEQAARRQPIVDPKAFVKGKVEELYAKSKTLYGRVDNIKFKSSKVKGLVKSLWQAQMNFLIAQIQAATAAAQKTGAGAQVGLQQAYGPKAGAPGAKPGVPAMKPGVPAKKKGLPAGRSVIAARAKPALQKKRLTLASNAAPPTPATLQLIVKLVLSRVPKRAGEDDKTYLRRLIRIVQRACLMTANLQSQGLSAEAAATRAVNAVTHQAELAILSAELRKGVRVAGGEEVLDAWMKGQIPAVAQTAAAAGVVATPTQSVPAAMAAANEVFTSQSLQPGSFRVSSDAVSNEGYMSMSESVAVSPESGAVVRMDASGKIVQDTSQAGEQAAKSFLPSEEAATVSNLPEDSAEGGEEGGESGEESGEGQDGETPWYKRPAVLLLGLAALGGLAYYGYKQKQSASAGAEGEADLNEEAEPLALNVPSPEAPETLG